MQESRGSSPLKLSRWAMWVRAILEPSNLNRKENLTMCTALRRIMSMIKYEYSNQINDETGDSDDQESLVVNIGSFYEPLRKTNITKQTDLLEEHSLTSMASLKIKTAMKSKNRPFMKPANVSALTYLEKESITLRKQESTVLTTCP